MYLDDTGAVHREKYTCQNQAERKGYGPGAKSHNLYLDFENTARGEKTHGIFGQPRLRIGKQRKS